MQDLGRSGRNSIAHLNQTEVAALQHTVLVTQFTCSNNLTRNERFRVAGIGNNFLAPDAVVLFHKLELVDNLLFQEASVARFVDFHLAHHLANDDFEVFVVNLHTLQTVNVLHFVDDILLYCRRAFDGQNV